MRITEQYTSIIVSGIFHILILAIPISFAVAQKYDEVEFFVITDEAPSMQKQHVAEKEEVKKVKKEIIKEIKPMTEPQRSEKELQVKEEKIIEPVAITEKIAVAPLPLETANPPLSGVQEVTPAPQRISHADQTYTNDVEFGTATGPRFLHKEIPVYPLMAKKFGKEGRVVLRLTIDAAGNLLHVEVTESTGYGFTESAIEAVRKSTFLAAKKNSKPILSRALLPIRFKLGKD